MDLQQVLSSLEKADAAGDTQAAQALADLARSMMAGQQPVAPITKPAGFSFKDLGTAFGQGAVGSTEAITNVAGAGNVASEYLSDVNKGLQQQYTPERQAEMQRQQERMKKAEQSGSTWEEIKAGAQNIAEAPLQSVAQGLGSFVPYVPAMFAGPVAAALGLSTRAVAAANVVAKAYAPVVGTAQGAGSVKGAIYDAVYKAEKEAGLSEEEAKQKADAAQDYAGKNLDQIALGAGLGYVASKGGVEKFLTKEGREKAGEKALLPRVAGAVGEETLTEGAQGGQERLASNIALQRTGRDVPTFQGVAGQAFQEGVLGGLTAGPVSAISGGKSKADIEQERLKKEQEQFEEQQKAFVAQQEKTKSELQVPETLALPPPSKKIEPVKEEAGLNNPLGNITKEELGPEVSGYVDQYRKSNNLPSLQSYSIEDVKDAMTQLNPEGEKGALDSILTAKTGFSGEENYTPQDVVNAAIEKNVAHETVGFQDFLQRTTGERDLNTMSPPQLYSAFKALSEMKRESDEQIVLPEGSNASRFTQDQYDKGRSYVTQQLASGEPLVASPVRESLKGVTGLKTDRDVHTLLQAVIRNEDLNVAKAGDDYQISAATPVKDARSPLPQGYSIEEGTYAEGERPAGFEITPEGRGKPLTTVDLEEEVGPKIERLTGLRQQEAAKMLADVNKYSGVVKAGKTSLDSMEARGLTGTEAYAKEKANQARREDVLSRRIKSLMDRIEEMSAPLKSKPVGTKPITTKKSTLTKDGKVLGTFPSRLDAEASMLTQLSDAELDQLSSDTRFGGITDRAVKEKERRKAPSGMPVKGTEAGLTQAGVYTQSSPEMAELEKILVAALSKFGLKDVALKVVRAIQENAEGSYEAKLIKIAFDAANPVRTMRHEAVHALKELGFFTKDQWRVLESKAKNEWVQKYLAGKTAVVDGKQMSRLDAYKKMGLSESEILEEAIADAFADFDVNKAPPGLMMALLNKLRNFFKALRQALTGAGFESAEDIFGKIEEGKLESRMDKADKAGDAVEKKQEKLSLYGEGVPLSTRGIMDRQTVIAQQELGLNTEAVRNRFNNVREIANALNRYTKVQFGVMDQNALTSQDSTEIAKAIADEVAYQLQSTSKTGTGLGWYSNNYPKAVRRLAKRFPELGNNEHAQSVFSALVAVTSNGERVAKNIDNAIKLYAKLRDGKPLVAMGNRRATALQNNLIAIRDLLEEHGTDFKRVLLEEITVKEMNATLREMGEETDSSYLADTVVPAAAVYFGPKLGAFYANLSGSEGYLTMDLWWTRSINRMRGLLMPKATEASIEKFRDMMDQPSATRDEVVAATIPLRNKYEEYGWMTELEHLAKSKEPAKKIKKDAWFAKAKREAGDAYEQLLFEHKLEKMANTIYKNEFEMLEEAPFTATDRKFMYDAARKAQQLLRNEDINLTLADIQAALWYYEKRLYEKLSGRKADDIGYEEAIIAQAGKGDGRARPSVVFSEQQDGRDGPGGEVQVPEQLRERSTGEITEKGLRDEELPSGEPTVRSSTRGREKFSLSGERGGQREDSRFTPLALAPSVKGFHGPDPRIVEVAERYAQQNGIDLKRQAEYVQVEGNKDAEDRATRIAKAYEDMRHDPQNPEVKEAYQNLIDQTIAQYEELVDAGYKFWFIDLENSDNLDYLSSPWNALRDMRSNKQMGIFPTNVGFGSNEDFDPSNNPLLQETDFEWPIGGLNGKKQKVLANDVFRAVHDAFGHGLEGAGFRATGEENAWQAHVRLFTGSAVKAITSETRGQNSAVNYGANGEFNRKASPADTIYADQKVGLMPAWTWKEGLVADKDAKYSLQGITLGEQQPEAQSFGGTHYGNAKVDTLAGSKYGTGIRGAERRRLDNAFDDRIKRRAYFYVAKEDGTMPLPESGLGGHVYTQTFNNILGPGKEMSRLFSKARGDSNDFESNVVDAGYDGYAVPNMGMMVVLNHDVPVNYEGTKAEFDAKKTKFSLREAPNTPEFKRWFGDSKVVDKNGKPLVVYHGTSRDFSEFKKRGVKPNFTSPQKNIGFFFTDDPQYAGQYAGRGFDKEDALVMPVYLSIKNPKYEPISLIDEIEDKWGQQKAKIYVEKLRLQGYDGIIFEGNTKIGSIREIVVFNPTQIKSATGNIGTYDAANPDIRYSLRDATDMFDPEEIKKSAETQYKSRYKLISIGIDDFLRLAKTGKQESKLSEATSRVKEGVKFTSIPYLYMDREGDNLRVTGHEGRHRAMALKQAGYSTMPVEIRSDIRWSEQTDPDRFDYRAKWPKRILSEEGAANENFSIAMPFTREQAPEDYQVSQKQEPKFSLRTAGEPATKENVLASMKMEQEKQPYMNCQLCVQMATGVPKLLDLPRVKKAQVGDVYTFNERKNMASHYAIDIGDGNIAEVEGWGEEVRTVPLQEVVDEYGEPDSILRPPSTAYTGKVEKAKFSLRDIKSEIESMPNGAQIFSAIKGATTTREEKGWAERITSFVAPRSFSQFRAQALDRYNQLSVREKDLAQDRNGIERLADSNAHSAALMSDLHAGVTAQVLGVDDGVGGVPVYDKGYTTVSNLNGTVKGPIEIFKRLAAVGDPTIYQAYQFWAAAKRGKRLLGEGREQNIDANGIAFANALEGKYPMFVDIQKDWIKFNNGLVKYQIDTGVISKEMGQEWMKYADYLPFYRQLDGEDTVGPKIYQSISGVKPTKKLKGSEAPLADFLETIVRNTHAAVQAGMKNVAAQRAGELAVQVGIGEKLDRAATGKDIITALENGKQVFYRIGDDLFVDAVTSLNIPELPFMSFLTAPSNLLRNLVTKDPGFMLTNLMRDSVSAYVTSGANIKPMIDTVQEFTQAMMNKSPEFDILKRAGVVGGYDYSKGVEASTESFAKQLRKRSGTQTKMEKRLKPVTGIWDFLEKGSEASDAATRIAVYKDTLKQTGNEAEALLRSLEVMNFNRKGSSALIRIATAGIPFLNARMQGLDILYRAGIRPIFSGTNPTEREKAVQRTFFVRAGMIMGISLMYAAAVKDEPEYEAQEEETKDNNWLITPLGIRIPTPFEIGFIFKTIPERIYRLAFSGSDTAEEFSESMKRGLVSTFAFNPIPQAALPVAEAIANYSTFTMRPIVGQNLLSIDPKYQVGPSTSVMAERLGEQLGVSPMKIDHIYKGYTGTMGMYLVDTLDTVFDLFSDNPRPAKRFEQTPVLKRFLIDPESRGNVTAYYAFKHSVDEAVRTTNMLEKRLNEDADDYQEKKSGLLDYKKYVAGLDKKMNKLQDEANMIRSSGMPAKEKRDALLEITQIQNELVSDIKQIKRLAKET